MVWCPTLLLSTYKYCVVVVVVVVIVVVVIVVVVFCFPCSCCGCDGRARGCSCGRKTAVFFVTASSNDEVLLRYTLQPDNEREINNVGRMTTK